MFALGGMLLFPACNNLLLSFVALEVLSLPLYLMAGLARRRRLLSQEAAVKYFLLGAFASAFFLYGVALLYGYAGSVDLGDILDATSVTGKSDTLLYLGIAMLSVGLLFKVGAVPVPLVDAGRLPGQPDAGDGADGLLHQGGGLRGAAAHLLRRASASTQWDWRPMIWIVAILTMLGGAVLAVTQTDVKRMLAYSSIAHTGFILVAVGALTATGKASFDGLSGALFYLLAYGFTTLASFAVVGLVRDGSGRGDPPRAVGRPRPAQPGRRRGLRLLALRPRGHPADQRLRREVRRLQGRHRGRRDSTGRGRRHRQRDHRVLLRQGRRADVLPGRQPGRPHGGHPRPGHRPDDRLRRRGHPVLGVLPQVALDWANEAAVFIR